MSSRFCQVTIHITPTPTPISSFSTGIGFSRNYIIAHSDAVIAVGGGSGTLSEIGHSWTLKRLIICMRGTGWSDRLAGKPLDHRTRFRHIPDDQIFSATTPHRCG